MNQRYYEKLLVYAIRGALARKGKDLLIPNEAGAVIKLAEELGVKAHYFKRANVLPRVRKVMGFLTSSYPSSLMDVGSGRGAFLFPFLDEFPYCEVTSLDILDNRVELLNDMEMGGLENFKAIKGDICTFDAPDKSFEVVTLLEVLEHIPNVKSAITKAIRLAKRYVVVTVPAEEDDNPEHIHLLTREKLTAYFNENGVDRLSFDAVHGHLVMIARIEK